MFRRTVTWWGYYERFYNKQGEGRSELRQAQAQLNLHIVAKLVDAILNDWSFHFL